MLLWLRRFLLQVYLHKPAKMIVPGTELVLRGSACAILGTPTQIVPLELVLQIALATVFVSMEHVVAKLHGLVEIAVLRLAQAIVMITEPATTVFACARLGILGLSVRHVFVPMIALVTEFALST